LEEDQEWLIFIIQLEVLLSGRQQFELSTVIERECQGEEASSGSLRKGSGIGRT
jgi:hypothetical protein